MLINAVPLVLNLLLYRMGGNFDHLFFLPCFCFLLWLNYRSSGVGGFLGVQFVYGLYTLAAGYLATMLYTRNISDDGMSYAIGQLFTVLELFFIFVVTVITLIIKYRKEKSPSE